jgi:3-deoxy-manno-octulosonate cytidylyltransferase (CMP-KDO synthetase)
MSVVIIPARYESTRLPGKPLAKIGGIPMIIHTAERCMKSKADRVIVVTDDRRVLDTCGNIEKLECSMSDPAIPSGTDRVALAAKYIEDDIVINVQGDEPFIDPNLINELIAELKKDKSLNMVTACTPFEADEDVNNPNAVKVVFDNERNALYFSRLPVPYDRDKIGTVRYRHIGIYGFRKDFLLKFASMDVSRLEELEKLEQLRALEAGEKIRVLVTGYKPVSVDTADDLIKAEEFLKGLANG